MITQSKSIKPWSLMQKLAMRAAFCYFVLYFIFMLVGPFLEVPAQWFSSNVLGWTHDYTANGNGSGDNSHTWVIQCFVVILALIGVATWSLIDRKRSSYNDLQDAFFRLLRAVLFAFMMLYGIIKLFRGQFVDHTYGRLLQTVGEMSPMALAWTFMGHSFTYQYFVGLLEVTGGIMMLFRRTVTAGGLLIIGVMGNVFLMNMTFDIPVKIFSFHLVMMAAILVLVDRKLIISLFAKPHNGPGFQEKTLDVIKYILVSVIVIVAIVQAFVQYEMKVPSKISAGFDGVWENDEHVINGDTLLPLLTDSVRWRYMIIDNRKYLEVRKMDNSKLKQRYEIDSTLSQITLSNIETQHEKHVYDYTLKSDSLLVMNGIIEADTIHLKFHRKLKKDFLLVNRGFHWINESPFVR